MFHEDVIFMLSIKIANVVPLSNMQLLVFFENGVIKKFDVKPIIKDYPEFEALEEPALFQMVKVEPGGYGVYIILNSLSAILFLYYTIA